MLVVVFTALLRQRRGAVTQSVERTIPGQEDSDEFDPRPLGSVLISCAA